MDELVRKYRPKDLDDVAGQEDAVRTLRGYISNGGLPHAILFTGPPGTGKTTLARILARKYLKCDATDLAEMNISDLTGVDTVRRIQDNAGMYSLTGKRNNRVWILDEVQGMGKPAQQAFLKILEEPPSNVYFLLCTTDPERLVKPIRSRCTRVRLAAIDREAMLTLLQKVAKSERIKVKQDVLDKIVDESGGAARDALNYLQLIKGIRGSEEQLAAITADVENADAFQLAKALMDYRTKWADLRPLLKKLEGQDVEPIRKSIIGYAAAVALNGGLQARAMKVYDNFKYEMIQSGKEPRSHLIFACLDVIGLPKGKR